MPSLPVFPMADMDSMIESLREPYLHLRQEILDVRNGQRSTGELEQDEQEDDEVAAKQELKEESHEEKDKEEDGGSDEDEVS